MRPLSPVTLQAMDIIRDEAIDLLLSNTAGFQAQLNELSRLYTIQERAVVQRMSLTGDGSFVDYYAVTIVPLLTDLSSVPSDTEFMGTFSNKLYLRPADATRHITPIVAQQTSAVRRRYVHQYAEENGIRRKSADKLARFLDHSDLNFLSVYDHHLRYCLYSELAERAGVPYIDSQANRWNQYKNARRLQNHQALMQSGSLSTEASQQRKQLLDAAYGMLIADLVARQWSLVEMLSLRNKYEKLVAKNNKLTNDDRLKLIETVTEKFIDKEITQRQSDAARYDSTSTLHTYKSELRHLIVQLFTLTPTQKNYLLKATKDYSDLADRGASSHNLDV